jgi:hypothetical protein
MSIRRLYTTPPDASRILIASRLRSAVRSPSPFEFSGAGRTLALGPFMPAVFYL